MVLSAHPVATRYAVLAKSYGAICLGACYAVSGTDIADGQATSPSHITRFRAYVAMDAQSLWKYAPTLPA
eukprot:3819720-Rhodomonas_salina.3